MEDLGTGNEIFIAQSHAEIHAGRHFHAEYSVADIGAATTPDDVISLSWKTPNSEKRMHLLFEAICTGGALVRLIRGKTGGGASPTGIVTARNNNENSSITSEVWNLAASPAQGSVSYDATVFTGGVDILGTAGIYMTGTAPDALSQSSGIRAENEIILLKNTFYQLSILETGNVPAVLKMGWYEKIPKS